MKALKLLIFLTLISISLLSAPINIKGVEINVIVNDIPSRYSNGFCYTKLSYTKNDYKIIISKLKQELNKYPYFVLKKYAPKDIYIVNNINNKNKLHPTGVSKQDMIVLTKSVFIGDLSEYLLITIHHEMFHQLTKDYKNKNAKQMFKIIDNNSNFKYIKNQVEENDVYTFNSEFVTTYHPNSREASAEIFSYLMYVSYFDPHNMPIIKWYTTKSADNDKLKINIAAVINFTAAISNNIMNSSYYMNFIK